MVELKPCAHCGAPGKIKRGKTVMVSCTECSASTFQMLDDKESAITAWNRRATPPSPSTAPQDELKCLPPFAAPAQHNASEGETLDQKAENALLWCYRRLKNSYGRLPFVEEAVAGLRERTAAAGAAREGGGNNSNSAEFDGIKPFSIAPTVEVDERTKFGAWHLEKFGYFFVEEQYFSDGGMQAQRWETWRAALASKPPAREAAERQSIDTPEFQSKVGNWAGAAHSCDKYTRTVGAKEAWATLIAHIDIWGARRNADPAPAGCKHMSTTPHWTHVTCNECGAVRTDGSWGIASNKWFKSEAEAKFYQSNGRYPEVAPAAGNTEKPKDE